MPSANPTPQDADSRLRASEERLRIVFEYAPDAYYLHDLEARFVDANRAAEELSGYRRQELIGKTFFEVNFLSPDGITQASKALALNAQGHAAGPDEYVIRKKDGTHVTVEI